MESPLPTFAPGLDPGSSFVDLLRRVAPHDLPGAGLEHTASGVPFEITHATTVVAIRYEGDDAVERYLVGSIEERRDDMAVISPGSPLGQALVGHQAGDTVEYAAPSGTLKVDIVEVGA